MGSCGPSGLSPGHSKLQELSVCARSLVMSDLQRGILTEDCVEQVWLLRSVDWTLVFFQSAIRWGLVAPPVYLLDIANCRSSVYVLGLLSCPTYKGELSQKIVLNRSD